MVLHAVEVDTKYNYYDDGECQSDSETDNKSDSAVLEYFPINGYLDSLSVRFELYI